MKTANNLGCFLRSFLSDYQPRQCNASPNTIRAYRDSLKQLLCHVAKANKCSVADLNLSDLEHQRILDFLESVETKRGNAISTRNNRLAAIRSFFRYVSQTSPEAVGHAAQILTIPTKKTVSKSVDYLTKDELAEILRHVPIETVAGGAMMLFFDFCTIQGLASRRRSILRYPTCDSTHRHPRESLGKDERSGIVLFGETQRNA